MVVTVPLHVQNPRINFYKGEGDLVKYIQRHEAFLPGRPNDDNPFALLIPSNLGASPHIGCLVYLKSWDLKYIFIVQYMGGRPLLKSVGTLDHTKQRNDGNLGDFYTCLNIELAGIEQVITGGKTNRAFVRVLGPKGSALYDNLSVIPVNTMEEMTATVKSYIDLEIAKGT